MTTVNSPDQVTSAETALKEAVPAATIAMTKKWLDAIQPIVARTNLTAEQVTQAILAKNIVSAADDQNAEVIVDPEAVENSDFFDALPSVPRGTLKKALSEMRKAAKPEVSPATTPESPTVGHISPIAPYGAVTHFEIPKVSNGTEFLQLLSTSKALTVEDDTVRVALEAFFAHNHNLADVPERLVDLMLTHAKTVEEPVGDQFDRVYELVTARKYADVGIDRRFVTMENKKELIERLKEVPPVTYQLHLVVSSWYEEYRQKKAENPFVFNDPSLYPSANRVIAASESVVGSLKKVFGGLGSRVAKAMAYEGLRVRQILEIPELPSLVGAPNRDLMLKKLGCEINNNDIAMEEAVARYVVFVATIRTKIPLGSEGPALVALYNLGNEILPWMTNFSSKAKTEKPGVVTRKHEPF